MSRIKEELLEDQDDNSFDFEVYYHMIQQNLSQKPQEMTNE